MPPAPIRAALAGAAHGVLEWLPVSSSGHVALLVDAAGWPEADATNARALRTLEVALHTGSLLPLGLRVLADVRAQAGVASQARLLGAGVGATAITSVIGATLGPVVEERFSGPRAVAFGLVLGSAALVATERRAAPGAAQRALADLRPGDVAVLGLAQGAAIWPGVSRRAATLAAGRAIGLGAAEASALSWSAGLPTLVGATTWQGYRDRAALRDAAPTVAAGAAASAAAGVATAALPDRTRRWPALAWAAWRLALAALTLARRREVLNRSSTGLRSAASRAESPGMHFEHDPDGRPARPVPEPLDAEQRKQARIDGITALILGVAILLGSLGFVATNRDWLTFGDVARTLLGCGGAAGGGYLLGEGLADLARAGRGLRPRDWTWRGMVLGWISAVATAYAGMWS
ncbi:MAG: undecaprenyl-diphosphate phosphatase [Solirubrobacteraceae bacterium]|nr:undecaprenyl-diphosphate phosphatase [Solirubrobacteraceae bacterium]